MAPIGRGEEPQVFNMVQSQTGLSDSNHFDTWVTICC